MIQESQNKINVFSVLENTILPIVKKAKRYLLAAPIVGAIVFLSVYTSENKTKPVFTSQITFMLEDEILTDQPSMGPGSQILAALGGQGTKNNKAIMVDLGTSNKLVEESLLQSVVIDGKKELLANRYIDKMGFRDQWKENKNQKLMNFYFKENYIIGTDKELDYLLRVFSNQIKKSLKPTVLESGLIEVVFNSNDELFTKLFLETHLNTISNFYINKKTQKSLGLVNYAKRKRDSLFALLNGKTYSLASMQDAGFGRVMRRSMVPEIQTKTDIGILNEQYSESVLALSAATIDWERKKPFISVVDDIRLPLDAEWPKPFKKALSLSIIGMLLSAAAVVGVIFGMGAIDQQRQEFQDSLKKQ
jgi:hypothetical protein